MERYKKRIPNLITLLRILLLPPIVYLMWEPYYNQFLVLGIYAFLCITDYIDGYFARSFKAITDTGKIVDPAADKLIVLITSLMLVKHGYINVLYPIIILSREITITTLRAVASSKNIILQASSTAKLKTILQMLGVGTFIVYSLPFYLKLVFGHGALILSIVFSIVSGYKYFRETV